MKKILLGISINLFGIALVLTGDIIILLVGAGVSLIGTLCAISGYYDSKK